jgi:RNA polymerase sigma-70 factor, ECF subfamily
MGPLTAATDEELLVSGDSAAFGVFYDRHARLLMGYFMRRTRDPEVAADLTAETFASAIVAQRRFKPGGAPAVAWLFTIARRRLADYHRRGSVDAHVRRALALERPPLSEDDARLIRLLADETTSALMAELPPDQRDAVAAHVLADRDYSEIASELHTSEAAVRQRVSCGLGTLRRRLGRRP